MGSLNLMCESPKAFPVLIMGDANLLLGSINILGRENEGGEGERERVGHYHLCISKTDDDELQESSPCRLVLASCSI